MFAKHSVTEPHSELFSHIFICHFNFYIFKYLHHFGSSDSLWLVLSVICKYFMHHFNSSFYFFIKYHEFFPSAYTRDYNNIWELCLLETHYRVAIVSEIWYFQKLTNDNSVFVRCLINLKLIFIIFISSMDSSYNWVSFHLI